MGRDWISKNAGKTGAAAPTISEGTVILQLCGAYRTTIVTGVTSASV
jgi:hypothetical protein